MTSRNARRTPHEPPSPPPFERKIRIGHAQLIGVSLLALIPLAALTGLFGLSIEKTRASAKGLELEVAYPDILRYGTSDAIRVVLRNAASAPVSGLVLRFDGRYLAAFDQVRMTPEPQTLTELTYEVGFPEVPSGQSRQVVVRVQADAYGRHRGQIAAVLDGQEVAEVSVATLVLP